MCYFDNAFEFPVETISAICHELNNPKFDRVDLIVGTGISGTLLLIPVSLKSGIRCGVVRKQNSGSHSGRKIETGTYDDIGRYVIIDDFVESGETVERIIKTITKIHPQSECVGIILYQIGNDGDKWREQNKIPLTRLGNDIIVLNLLRCKDGVLV